MLLSALGLAALAVGDETIYESQLRTRADAPAHRALHGLPLLGSITIDEAISQPRLILRSGRPAAEALAALQKHRLYDAPLVDAGGRLRGVVHRDQLASNGRDERDSRDGRDGRRAWWTTPPTPSTRG